jgi:hypothetical protein
MKIDFFAMKNRLKWHDFNQVFTRFLIIEKSIKIRFFTFFFTWAGFINPLSPIVAKMLHMFYNYFSQHNLSKLARYLFE